MRAGVLFGVSYGVGRLCFLFVSLPFLVVSWIVDIFGS